MFILRAINPLEQLRYPQPPLLKGFRKCPAHIWRTVELGEELEGGDQKLPVRGKRLDNARPDCRKALYRVGGRIERHATLSGQDTTNLIAPVANSLD